MSNKIEAVEMFDGAYWQVLLNPDQQNLGKTLVILKSEKRSLAELTVSEWGEFGQIVKKVEEAINIEFNPTHFNWQCLMNNAYGPDATDTPHVHWHVTPRYDQPVVVSEHEFIDQNYPRTNKEAKIVEQGLLEAIASRIRPGLII